MARPATSPAAETPLTPVSPALDLGRIVTMLIVVGPFLATMFAAWSLFDRGITLVDFAIALAMYVVVGHGVTIGFHRMLSHRAFVARRPLKVALAIAGSMSFEGPLLGWVADHRRHHTFTDRVGDPHSPHLDGDSAWSRAKGIWHSHSGWLFRHDPPDLEKLVPDLAADDDLRRINALFPLWCILSLAIPFGLGWLLGGTLAAALTALLWGGGVRIFALHHVTWSINSLCHVLGSRPFRTRDHSTNVAVMSVISFGESWHNAHHAFPQWARHGVDRHQLDSSASLIRLFERLGLAHEVRWPVPERREAKRFREVPAHSA